jgi:hypothetical protein
MKKTDNWSAFYPCSFGRQILKSPVLLPKEIFGAGFFCKEKLAKKTLNLDFYQMIAAVKTPAWLGRKWYKISKKSSALPGNG